MIEIWDGPQRSPSPSPAFPLTQSAPAARPAGWPITDRYSTTPLGHQPQHICLFEVLSRHNNPLSIPDAATASKGVTHFAPGGRIEDRRYIGAAGVIAFLDCADQRPVEGDGTEGFNSDPQMPGTGIEPTAKTGE